MLALKLGLSLNNIKTLGDWNPDDESSLEAWYKNKTGVTTVLGNVSQWADSSSNSYDMVQADGTEQPSYNAATGRLRFTATNSDNLQLSSGKISLSSDFTIGMKIHVAASLGVPIASNTDTGEFFRFTSTTELRIRIDNTTAINITLDSGTWGTGYLVVTRTLGTMRMYWNGSIQSGSATLTGTADIDALGVRKTDLNPFDGDMFEVQIYSSASTSLASNVNSYLAAL